MFCFCCTYISRGRNVSFHFSVFGLRTLEWLCRYFRFLWLGLVFPICIYVYILFYRWWDHARRSFPGSSSFLCSSSFFFSLLFSLSSFFLFSILSYSHSICVCAFLFFFCKSLPCTTTFCYPSSNGTSRELLELFSIAAYIYGAESRDVWAREHCITLTSIFSEPLHCKGKKGEREEEKKQVINTIFLLLGTLFRRACISLTGPGAHKVEDGARTGRGKRRTSNPIENE